MVWLAVSPTGIEKMFRYEKPKRISEFFSHRYWHNSLLGADGYFLERGTIKRLIGRELTWDDEPVEFNEMNNEPIATNP